MNVPVIGVLITSEETCLCFGEHTRLVDLLSEVAVIGHDTSRHYFRYLVVEVCCPWTS